MSAHPDVYQRFRSEQDKEMSGGVPTVEGMKKIETQLLNRVNLSKSTLKKAILELVTVNGRPFSILEDSGMRKILKPILERLPSDEKLNITPESVKLYVYEESDRIIQLIKHEVQSKKLISLKVDVASRHGRSFLGLNIQFVQDGKILIRTLGVVELTDKHTSEHLKNVIFGVFEKFNISINNIYSFTSDNAANMLKLHSLLETSQNFEVPELCDDAAEDSDNENEDDINDGSDETDIEMDNEDPDDQTVESVEKIFTDEKSRKIVNIRCAAHTLQLAIDDGIRMSKIEKLIAKARKAAKYLRKDSVMNQIKKLFPTTSKPILDVVTRWHSTHDMLASLLNFKDYPTEIKYLCEKDWEIISIYVEVLKPAKVAIKVFQNEQLIMPEFFSAWLLCKEEIQKFDIPFARNLVECMTKREQKLLKNEALLGSIFLDPLLNCLLEEDQKTVAMNHLEEVWIEFQKMNSCLIEVGRKDDSIDISEDDSSLGEKIKTMPSILKEKLHKKKKAKLDISSIKDLKPILQRFYNDQERNEETNLLDFWEKNKFVHPELYQMAMILLATPATQVSVERLFSGLKYIFSDLRGKLSPNILNAIMVVRTNYRDLCSDEKRINTKKRMKTYKPIGGNSSSESSNLCED